MIILLLLTGDDDDDDVLGVQLSLAVCPFSLCGVLSMHSLVKVALVNMFVRRC